MEEWQPQEAGHWRRKLSQTERDLARDLRDCSLLCRTFREDCDCSSWKALSFLAAAVVDLVGRLRRSAAVVGVCLEAVKNWVEGDLVVVKVEREGRFGVLKLEMSLRREEEWGNGEGQGNSSPSIVVME